MMAEEVDSKAEPPLLVEKVVEAEENSVVIPPSLPVEHKHVGDGYKLAPPDVEKLKVAEMTSKSSIDRDAVLERVATEKRLSLIKAWEESEKSKAENKAQRKLSAIEAWENSKKANLEAKLKKKEEQLEKRKGEHTEKTKNKVALVHKLAEEKRAVNEALRGEDLLKAEESAAKYRATGTAPRKLLGFF